MGKWLLLFFIWLPAAVCAAASSVARYILPPRVWTPRGGAQISFKNGGPVYPQAYEEAQNKLHDMRLFKKYMLRNDTGLLALRPFYELAYVYAGNAYRDHSGAGTTLSYKFRHFPFPLGLNYTRNLSDRSDMVSFVLGGQF